MCVSWIWLKFCVYKIPAGANVTRLIASDRLTYLLIDFKCSLELLLLLKTKVMIQIIQKYGFI